MRSGASRCAIRTARRAWTVGQRMKTGGRKIGYSPLRGAQLSPGRAMDTCSLELEAGAFAPESRTELLEDRPRVAHAAS